MMDILIIGSGNEEIVGKIKEMAKSEEDISVSVVEDCTISSIRVGSPKLAMVDSTPTLMELSERFNENILRTIEPIKAAKEPNLFEFSGYEHTFGKILHIKRQLDFDNTKCLSMVNCNQNKSLLKQHNIKQQPILYRRHGVDNRR